MYPSLLAEETRRAVTEYLSTTFALADDDAQAALEGFLLDRDAGIFRGPYLRVRTPFQPVEESYDPRLRQVTAGVYIGGEGRHDTPTREHLVDARRVLTPVATSAALGGATRSAELRAFAETASPMIGRA